MNSRESSNEPQDVDPPGNDEVLSNDEENATKLDEENIEIKGGDDNEMQTNDTEDQPKSVRKRGGRKRRKPGKPTVLKQEEANKIKVRRSMYISLSRKYKKFEMSCSRRLISFFGQNGTINH